MNLDKIVKHGKEVAIVTAGLVGAVLGSGCNIETIYGMGIAGNAYKTHDPYAANVMGNALMREGEAKEGRSETVVVVQQPREENSNNNNPQPQPQREEEDLIFACESCKDANGDGKFAFDEIKGMKQRKFEGGSFAFVIYNTAKRGDLKFVFKNEKGEILRDVTDADCQRGLVRIRDPPKIPLPYGKYTGEWYRNGILLGKTEIEWLPGKKH
jgi:hypothetical protein